MHCTVYTSQSDGRYVVHRLLAGTARDAYQCGRTTWRMSYIDRLAHVDLNTNPENLWLSNSLKITQIGKPSRQNTGLTIL